MKENKNIVSIGIRLMIPILLIITLSIGSISIYSFLQQKNIINEQMEVVASTEIQEISLSIESGNKNIATLSEALNKNFIIQAKLVAETSVILYFIFSTYSISKLSTPKAKLYLGFNDTLLRCLNLSLSLLSDSISLGIGIILSVLK